MKKENMKIYFSGSIHGGVERIEHYGKIVNYLQNYGEVINETANVAAHIIGSGEKYHVADDDYYKRVLVLVSEPDVIVIGIGEDASHAVKIGERILCLFNSDGKKDISKIKSVNTNMMVRDYQEVEDAYKTIDDFFSSFDKKPTT